MLRLKNKQYGKKMIFLILSFAQIRKLWFPRVKMFDPTIAFDKDYMVFVAPAWRLFLNKALPEKSYQRDLHF